MSKWPSSNIWISIFVGVVIGNYLFHLTEHGDWVSLIVIPLVVGTVAVLYRIEHR